MALHRRRGSRRRRASGQSGAVPRVEQFDRCYHLVCDTYGNVNLHALDVNSDVIAYAELTFAYSTESVNGVPGKKVPGPPAAPVTLAGPEGTFVP